MPPVKNSPSYWTVSCVTSLSSGLKVQGSDIDSDEVIKPTANDWFIALSKSLGLAVQALDGRALEHVRELEEAIF
jgi:hypothetical protein